LFRAGLADVFQKSCFSCTGLTGQEYIAGALIDKINCNIKNSI